MTQYNIPNLFLEGFGLKVGASYRPEKYNGKPDDPQSLFSSLKIIEDENDTNQISGVGTQIIFPLIFQSGKYKVYNNKGEIVDKEMESFRLPIASIVSFKRDKIISETPINGSTSTVKEIYGFKDWDVTINGFLIPDASQPQNFNTVFEQEKQLSKWDSFICSIPVFGKPFGNLNIRNITIKGISFEPMRGRPNIRSFTVDAVSDEPIELNIKSTL